MLYHFTHHDRLDRTQILRTRKKNIKMPQVRKHMTCGILLLAQFMDKNTVRSMNLDRLGIHQKIFFFIVHFKGTNLIAAVIQHHKMLIIRHDCSVFG